MTLRRLLSVALLETNQRQGPEQVQTLLAGLDVRPVFTAHPTAARRRAVATGFRRVADLLERAEGVRPAPSQRSCDGACWRRSTVCGAPHNCARIDRVRPDRIAGLVFSLTGRDLFNPVSHKEEHITDEAWSVRRSVSMLAIAGVAVGIMSEILVRSSTEDRLAPEMNRSRPARPATGRRPRHLPGVHQRRPARWPPDARS